MKDISEATTAIKCELLIKSIGYKSIPLEGVPFDPKTNTIPNHYGCVVDKEG